MNDPYGQRPYQVSAHFDADLPMFPESHCCCEFCDETWCSDDQEDMNPEGDYSITVCFDCEASGLYEIEDFRYKDTDDGGLPALQETPNA